MSHSRRNSTVVRAGIDLISSGLLHELNARLTAQRRWWVKPWVSRRESVGASSTLLVEWAEENPEEYRNHLRMDENPFAYLLEKITPFIKRKDTWFREALNPKIKRQMTLRYLATGDNMGTLSALYRVPRCTFSVFLPETCESIYNASEDFIMVPNTVESWEKVMRDYETLWNFPNVCGAMDGKHVNIKCPPNTGSQYFNYKKDFSTILFAIVDANYNFLYIDVGTNGRVNDASVFAKSTFNVALQNNSLKIPEQGIFVADDAFPLRTNILKPFSRCGPLTEKQNIFNYRLSRARRVVENTFGILVSKFRIFEKPIPLSVDTTKLVVKTSCALHNWLRNTCTPTHPYIQRDMMDFEDWDEGRVVPGNATHLPRSAKTNYTRAAGEVRNDYSERLVTTDVVPWQWKMI